MKNSYYFPHDYHARNDPKLEKVRFVMGCEGIGIYWCLIEMLYEQNGYLSLNDLEIYAKILNTTTEKIKNLIDNFELFEKTETHFFSPSCLRRIKEIDVTKRKRSTSAKKRWDANAMQMQCKSNANAMQMHSNCNANAMHKIKENKIKENKINNKEKKEEIYKEERKEKISPPFNNKKEKFEQIWGQYPSKTGKKQAQRHFFVSVNTEKDWQDIQIALKNYLESERVYKGFIMNGSTWFNNWRDWVEYTEPVCQKCKGKGKYTSVTGYEIVCDCKAGKRIKEV